MKTVIVLGPIAMSWIMASSFVPAANLPADAARQLKSAAVVSLDGPGWLIAADPKNVGRDQKW